MSDTRRKLSDLEQQLSDRQAQQVEHSQVLARVLEESQAAEQALLELRHRQAQVEGEEWAAQTRLQLLQTELTAAEDQLAKVGAVVNWHGLEQCLMYVNLILPISCFFAIGAIHMGPCNNLDD